jgi:tetratricopeptide (TPR) repeat protein
LLDRLSLLIPLLLTAVAMGDVITLDDGSVVQGRIVRTPQGWHITQADGTSFDVGASRIKSIQVGDLSTQPSAAADALDSLRNAVDHATDISQIISRYQRFISQNSDPDVLKQANQDLLIWQERLDDGLVKIGDKWVTPQQRDRLQQQAQTQALAARDLLLQERRDDAAPLLQQILTDDPQNATALYLQGVLFYAENNLADSRHAFFEADKIVPRYPPTLNNLAVLCWQQGSYLPALGYYNNAMRAGPPAKEILDNVAEALNAVPAQYQNSPIVAEVTDRFTQQDAVVQRQESKVGLFRWGAIWVPGDQFKQIKADDDRSKKQFDELRSEYDALQQKIGAIDAEVDQNDREMHRLEAQNTFVGQDGGSVMLLPQSYWDLQDDNKRLAQSKTVLQQQQSDLQKEALIVQQRAATSSVQKYTGVQQIIGVEAAPLRTFASDSPATAPATQP